MSLLRVGDAITALAALAHEHRLAIYRLLVRYGSEGLPAGVVAKELGLAPSSLTFHLQHLARAGLLTQRRVGRQIFYATDFAAMSSLIGYLTEECCTASGESCAPTWKESGEKDHAPIRRRRRA